MSSRVTGDTATLVRVDSVIARRSIFTRTAGAFVDFWNINIRERWTKGRRGKYNNGGRNKYIDRGRWVDEMSTCQIKTSSHLYFTDHGLPRHTTLTEVQLYWLWHYVERNGSGVELRTLYYENPASNPGCGIKTLGKFFHSTLLQFTQLNKWVPGYRQWWICVGAAFAH